ncbi:Hypothetical protein LBF_1322 [Leptospira biflexa serovar Patoc strain 'Patoc 1 (Ames)']|uniref:Uncharacterized protein n=2 Tax=Leptospira biflexa TaxID=172 RepID=B0SPR8_LEPBP|nr:Hypothetical protein LBF_1322 [Leptospira biflexa serovar Patoc strain 'Patoc 1 (Ames)']ABZ97484.1 Hypothetical protein; putative membrane protein [Leptospira biflexa serovar Patoc strain 'Patoc 1 (Paris)']
METPLLLKSEVKTKRNQLMLLKLLKQSQPYTIFLLDALGASLSLLVLFAVIVPFQPYFGMPLEVLQKLGILAGIMFFYSNTCFMQKPKHWKWFLFGVILGNLTYCGFSMYFLFQNWIVLQPLGAVYFIWEKIVILAIVAYEGFILTKSEESLKA